MFTHGCLLRAVRLSVMLGALCSATGCAQIDLKPRWPWADKQPKPQHPVRLTAIWTDTVLHQPGRAGTRGFGGRMMFYAEKGDLPVPVEGKLTVYAFNETHRDQTSSKPNRKFVFTTEQLPKHYSESELGPSYSFWLPWDDVQGEQVQISLITRFEPATGGVVLSEMTHHALSGSRPEEAVARAPARPAAPQDQSISNAEVRSVAFQAATDERKHETAPTTEPTARPGWCSTRFA